jgi:hypothetical protein
MAQATTKQIVVTGCRSVYQGTNANGDYEIFEVDATNPDGTPIAVPLRSFSEIPAGPGEFDVTPYTNSKGETSYTLKGAGNRRTLPAAPGVTAAAFASLVERVDALEQTP